MSATARDLKYYLAHPEEMPEDPKEIEKLANEHMAAAQESGGEQLTVDKFVPADEKKDGEASAAKPEEKPAEVPAEETKAPAAEAVKAPEASAEVKPEGILAKDGKNLIPYSQLESARARATAAEALAKSQAEKIAALEAEKTVGEVDGVEMLTEDELKVLEADSPTLAKTLRAQQAAIVKLSDTVEKITERQTAQAVSEETVVKNEIQTAIDLNPTLAAWQADKDQTMWNEASRFDRLLRESPKYADVPFADRFAKVVELTQSALGVEAPREDAPAPTQAEVKAAAEVALKAKAKTAVPRSLSDIPGGAPPAVDEKQKVEQMSSVALGQSFMSMTREQLDTYLQSL